MKCMWSRGGTAALFTKRYNSYLSLWSLLEIFETLDFLLLISVTRVIFLELLYIIWKFAYVCIWGGDEVAGVMVNLVLMIGWGVFCLVGLSGALSSRGSLAPSGTHSKTNWYDWAIPLNTQRLTIHKQIKKIIKNAKITLDNNIDMEKGFYEQPGNKTSKLIAF